jgi:hypothetical protein
MPIFCEESAQLLLFATRAGLLIRPGVDCRAVLLRLAELMRASLRDGRGLTHYGTATWFLDDLEKRKFVNCSKKDRNKVLAVLGTGVANLHTAHAHRAL